MSAVSLPQRSLRESEAIDVELAQDTGEGDLRSTLEGEEARPCTALGEGSLPSNLIAGGEEARRRTAFGDAVARLDRDDGPQCGGAMSAAFLEEIREALSVGLAAIIPPQERSRDGGLCSICFDKMHASDDRDCVWGSRRWVGSEAPCSHTFAFCNSCVLQYASGKINTAQVLPRVFKCPHPGCTVALTAQDVQELTDHAPDGPVLWEKYERFLREADGRVPCPTPNCGTVLPPFKGSRSAPCPNCGKRACAACGQAAHAPWRRSCAAAHAAEFERYVKSAGVAGEGVHRCPSCHFWIEKEGGCNHMTCARCSQQFCWRCRSLWTTSSGCPLPKPLCYMAAFASAPFWGTTTEVRVVTKSLAAPVLLGLGVATAGIAVAAASVGAVGFAVYATGRFAKKGIRAVQRRQRQQQQRVVSARLPRRELLVRGLRVLVVGERAVEFVNDFANEVPGSWVMDASSQRRSYWAYATVDNESSLLLLEAAAANTLVPGGAAAGEEEAATAAAAEAAEAAEAAAQEESPDSEESKVEEAAPAATPMPAVVEDAPVEREAAATDARAEEEERGNALNDLLAQAPPAFRREFRREPHVVLVLESRTPIDREQILQIAPRAVVLLPFEPGDATYTGGFIALRRDDDDEANLHEERQQQPPQQQQRSRRQRRFRRRDDGLAVPVVPQIAVEHRPYGLAGFERTPGVIVQRVLETAPIWGD